MDTKTLWWNSHNHSKWAFICKYNCTIKGLELNVVLEEKLHGLDILSPDKLSLLFFNKKPFQLKTLSAWVLVAATQRYFSRQPPKSWKLWPPWPPLALVQSWLQANNYELQILSFSIINQLSSASSSSSSLRISSDSSKSSSLLLGSKGRCCAADWLRFFAITRVLFLQPSEYRYLICQIIGN